MSWLVIVLHLFIGSTLAGSLIIAALVMNAGTIPMLLGAAVLGYVIAVPISWVLAKRLTDAG